MIHRKKIEQAQAVVIGVAVYLALASAPQAQTNHPAGAAAPRMAAPAAGPSHAPAMQGAAGMGGGANMHFAPQANAHPGLGGTNAQFAQAHGPHFGAAPGHHEFVHHDVAHFSREDWDHWHGGHWSTSCFGGRCGWWWSAGGQRYFYERPIYPYPLFVSEVAYVEPVAVVPAPVVVAPAPIVVTPVPVVVAPAPVVVAPAPAVIVQPASVVIQR